MKHYLISRLAAAFTASLLCIQIQAQQPAVTLMDAARLATVKQDFLKQDAKAVSLVNGLRTQADKFLDMKPVSVMDKPTTPTSGSKHDYMSQAPYFWYDSSKPNGLPYMRKDGQRNPEIYTITDHRFMGDLDNACRNLALAWFFTHDEKYAAKAASLLRSWFFDEATRMNPNLTYAQAVPGVNDGRGTGIIESISLMGIADAAGLLEGSAAWTNADAAALKKWYGQFLQWMLTSANGKDEHAAKNNHGAWYLAQATDFALFVGDKTTARKLAEDGKKKIDGQIQPDGKMPLELARTNSLHYTIYCLEAWFKLATLARKVDVDLWNYRNPQGASIRTAFDWVGPFASGAQQWTYQEISGFKKTEFYPLQLQAAKAYDAPQYAAQVPTSDADGGSIMLDILYR